MHRTCCVERLEELQVADVGRVLCDRDVLVPALVVKQDPHRLGDGGHRLASEQPQAERNGEQLGNRAVVQH